MELTPRRHELLSTYLLGIGTLFLYIGYSAQAFISESVIHMVHEKSPEVISQYAGYYGTAFHYVAFALSSLVTPSLQHYVQSKWILTIASALFAVYYLGFLHLNAYYFYATQALMGLAYSLFNNGEGAYLSEHSSRRTLESNTGIETAVGHFSMFFGGIALVVLFSVLPADVSTSATSAAVSFSQLQVQCIYGTMFVLNVVSVLIFCFLPTKQYDSIASKSSAPIPSFSSQLKQMFVAFKAPNMVLLLPFFLFQGLSVSFLMSVYPTTLTFTSTFSSDVFIIGIYSISMGVAEAIGGLFLRPLIKKAKQHGLLMTISVNFLLYAVILTLACLSVPDGATLGPATQQFEILTSSRYLVFIIGFLIGLSDFCVTMSRAVICQVAVPECRMQVFSLSKLYQSAASVAALLLTPYMRLRLWASVLACFLLVGTLGFVIVARRTAPAKAFAEKSSSSGQLANKI
ncbi:unnamed protein product [Caenorhabditis auriculariae]|uniref:Uncharacterized protein n=1 Tax=Caenorhabditis auriculariae TaxID=2777116 RepID=A0A8S1HBW6_9PELO|nr:unnamed protein product [Caenorhabditis auriculariae]